VWGKLAGSCDCGQVAGWHGEEENRDGCALCASDLSSLGLGFRV